MTDAPNTDAPIANAPQHFEPDDVPFVPRPAAAPDMTVHMIGNAHIDVVWLWPWQEGYQEARATFASILDRMDEYPDFVFTCDQVLLLAWVEEQDPALFARIRQRVAEGRWVNTGGWWVEADCNLPAGESFVRQGLYGQRFLQQRFGRIASVGMNVDPFGHHAMLPAILTGQRMNAYCFLRPMASEKALPQNLFRWRSPDGSEVLAFRIPFEYQSSRESVDRHLEKALAEFDPSVTESMVFYGVGNHGGGPTVRQIETIHRFDRMGSFGALPMSSPQAYFDVVRQRGAGDLPVVDGGLQHHAAGCYSAHSGITQWQRRAHTALLVAERWAVVAAARDGVAYPREDLERAWKQVLLNQVHDVLPGSAIEAAYDDARDQLGEAVAVAKRITARSHAAVARRVDVPLDPSTQPVLVFNHHPWPVTASIEVHLGPGMEVDPARVTDAAGALVPSQAIASRSQVGRRAGAALVFRAELPPFGVRRYALHAAGGGRFGGGGFGAGGVGNTPRQVAPAPPRPDAAGDSLAAPVAPPVAAPIATRGEHETVLENDLIRAVIDHRTGWFSSLLDRRTGVDLLRGARGEHLQICRDPTDTWGHRVVSYAWPGASMETARIVLRENGPYRAAVRVERRWHRSRMAEEFLLTRDGDAIEVRVELDWQERAHLLKLRVPVALTEPAGRIEIPFGSIECPVNGAEEPGQSWIDLTGTAQDAAGRDVRVGLALVNDAKHGYDLSPGDAGSADGADTGPAGDRSSPSTGVTVVRSPVFAWHDPTVLDPEGVYSYQDQGFQRFTYALVPHGGDRHGADLRQTELHRRATELTMRPRAMLESFHPGDLGDTASWASITPSTVLVTAIKGTEDVSEGSGGTELIIRAVETAGERTEAVIDIPLTGHRIETVFEPNRIRTWRIPLDSSAAPEEVDLLESPPQPALQQDSVPTAGS
ncbi:alpha-mannosidase [uncultured Amnibacterium sp.]|uniref:alpha-mannosidase n=1 Tax=uncultured Amnibacterium sp. TaxID=1631851 RepID=UPI0035C9A27D